MKTVIAKTTKGHRVWLQGTCEKFGWPVGARYSVTYGTECIELRLDNDNGKRRVSTGKGGIIDLVGKKVTGWAQGAQSATIVRAGQRIIISRGTE